MQRENELGEFIGRAQQTLGRLEIKTTHLFFDRKGNPLQLLEYARLFEDKDYKVVKQEYVGKYFVSTVWVGLNMAFRRTQGKLIFETMIFLKDEEDEESEDPLRDYQERYGTEEEALEGHEKAVKIARGEIPLYVD